MNFNLKLRLMENFAEPTLIQALRAHRGEITCVDAYGGRLVTGGGDKTLRLWLWTAGTGWAEEALAKSAHRYGVTAARWSPGAALIASSGVDGAVRVWCGRTLTARRLLAAPAAPAVRSLCWVGSGRLLAGHDDGALCIWHVFKCRLLTRLVAHEGSLHAVAAPADGALLLTACTHGVLKVYDLEAVCKHGSEGGSPPLPLTWIDGAHDMGALCADASADGTAAATGGHDSKIRLWRVNRKTFEEGPTLEGHSAAVTSVRWARGVLASASLDRTARLWAADGVCLAVLHAHTRYLTCVLLPRDLAYVITGSNDKSVRMWSLGKFNIDCELETKCSALAHFALGDLEGIGPVDAECDMFLEAEASSSESGVAEGADGSGARCVWRETRPHSTAVNCVAAHGDLVATASSNGSVRVLRWLPSESSLRVEHELEAHGYPALSVHFGAGGATLLTAGLDGQAVLWDVQLGCRLRTFSAGVSGGGEAGGGGVRDARLSPHHPPLVLLATDDGLAPLFSLADVDPAPLCVYGGWADAVTCCAWEASGRVAAAGGAAGELRILAPPPDARSLCAEPDAHDLGVQCCEFAPPGTLPELQEDKCLLATAGCDQLAKLWIVTLTDDLGQISASLRLFRTLEAHGGAVSCVRWAPHSGHLLTSGVDEWARLWEVASGRCVAALPAWGIRGSGGSVATAALGGGVVVVATLAGELAVWRQGGDMPGDDDDVGLSVRGWGTFGVTRWLQEYVTRAPGLAVSPAEEAELLQRARTEQLTGTTLLDDPIENLLEVFGYVAEEDETSERAALRERIVEELKWLRRPLPTLETEMGAPHCLLCPLSHRLLLEPARAADGFTYERNALHEWYLAADGPISGVSGRRVRNTLVVPNYGVRDALREYLDTQQQP